MNTCPAVPVPTPAPPVKMIFPPFALPDVSRAAVPDVIVIAPPAAAPATLDPAVAADAVMLNGVPAVDVEAAAGAFAVKLTAAVAILFAIVMYCVALPVGEKASIGLPLASSISVVIRGDVARRLPLPAVTLVPSDVKPLISP